MYLNELTAHIQTPTLVLNEETAKRNLARMAGKAAAQGIRFRPHFKTHQSALVGEWMRAAGVESITVSSVDMAGFFTDHGWRDILVAFPVNLREYTRISELAKQIALAVLVESVESAAFLDARLESEVGVWIKVDTGLGRAGIWWEEVQEIAGLARLLLSAKHLQLCGLLTHAGQTYDAVTADEIKKLYAESNDRMNTVRNALSRERMDGLQISVGDTPGCWLSDDLGTVDEIRPGNFIFFDAMMHNLGVCRLEDIAVAVACPVVAKHARSQEVIVYGGAVHLSKESFTLGGQRAYGYAAVAEGESWRVLGVENYVRALSQEHGIVRLQMDAFSRVHVGDLLYIIPAHVCLAVHALRSEFIVLSGASEKG